MNYQVFNIICSNLIRIARIENLMLSDFYCRTSEVNMFQPSSNDVKTIITSFEKLFNGNENQAVKDYLKALNKMREETKWY